MRGLAGWARPGESGAGGWAQEVAGRGPGSRPGAGAAQRSPRSGVPRPPAGAGFSVGSCQRVRTSLFR